MIKLQFPFDLPQTRAICEVPYGMAERPADATEYPYGRWVRLESEQMTVGIANNGQNGLDVDADGTLNLSITRGGVHCHWDEESGGLDTARSFTWMDQTQIDTRFRLLARPDRAVLGAELIPAALELNQPLERFFVYYPPSPQPDAPTQLDAFLRVEPATIVLGALKKADHEDALVVRLSETIGQPTTAQVQLKGDNVREIEFQPYEIKTFKIMQHPDGIDWQASNILEA
jgi:alpha-mannosidase